MRAEKLLERRACAKPGAGAGAMGAGDGTAPPRPAQRPGPRARSRRPPLLHLLASPRRRSAPLHWGTRGLRARGRSPARGGCAVPGCSGADRPEHGVAEAAVPGTGGCSERPSAQSSRELGRGRGRTKTASAEPGAAATCACALRPGRLVARERGDACALPPPAWVPERRCGEGGLSRFAHSGGPKP